MQRLLWQVDRSRPDVLVGVKPDLLEHAREAGDLQFTVAARNAVVFRTVEGIEHLHGHRCERVGVVVDLDRPHVGFLLVPVQPVDVKLRALV